MNEKEKIQKGQLYYAEHDPLLKEERNKCKVLCSRYNNMPYENIIERYNILKEIIGKYKNNFTIEPSFWCDYGYNIELGENFYSNHNLVILDCAKVKFGDNVLIGPNCGFYTAGHPLDTETRNKGLEFAKPITVGNNVWIGGGVQVMPDVKIGNNVVIASGAVVVKDIEDNSLYGGIPAKLIKKI